MGALLGLGSAFGHPFCDAFREHVGCNKSLAFFKGGREQWHIEVSKIMLG